MKYTHRHRHMYPMFSLVFGSVRVCISRIFFSSSFILFFSARICVISMKRIKKLPDRVGSQPVNNVVFVFVN